MNIENSHNKMGNSFLQLWDDPIIKWGKFIFFSYGITHNKMLHMLKWDNYTIKSDILLIKMLLLFCYFPFYFVSHFIL